MGMTVEEFNKQEKDANLKYRMFHCATAYELGLPGFEQEPKPGDWAYHDSYYVLFRCENGIPVEEVFRDNMQPEDAILPRDLRVLVELLNKEAEHA